ncbi:hypothetical protein Q5M87_10385 [Brachyspira innocens]|uniref:Uncharacterized protein n=1 Tax=Brachyspira innocens TaxID=13264 RepID=A0ABT8YWD1_9SPIR|nr:hypothetical protein [Brachyspira innocens]MDO6994413.1 hypothetical protein [Brachyspira innocens]MDO7019800.1 hypothetical protein [Brachyspira innocens]
MTKEEVREKIYKDKNIETIIKDNTEIYLDFAVLKKYSNNAVSEYEYIGKYSLITTEIFENGYVISDIHINVNMKVYDYMSIDDNKKERYIASDKNYFLGLKLKFVLKNIDDDIEDIETGYFSVYASEDNL